ncbi:MAG: small acid-soluble spore protein SspI [Gorillibacterium sp.]|nr:small acid-soluble spore protein SspI [Gorillibacterium sp.]
MNINLRDAVVARVKGKSEEELHEVIKESIGGDDMALPGLGVLFENIWNNSESTLQDTMVKNLEKSLD